MTRVADKNGNPIEGLSRDSNHGLVVHDPIGFAKYMKEKERVEDIEGLKKDVSEIKDMMSAILKAINGIPNTQTSSTDATISNNN